MKDNIAKSSSIKTMFVMGTRPEVIELAPVIKVTTMD